MVTFLARWSAKKRVVATLLIGLTSINQIADAKTLSCTCSYQETGVTYSIAYVAEGGGCCTGNASNGAGLYEYEQKGVTKGGYIRAAYAQSLCCGNMYAPY